MNNFIEYFYNLKIKNIIYSDNYSYFNYNGYNYKLYIIDNTINLNLIIYIDKQLLNHTLISEIIINKDGNYISSYNGINYILIKIYVNDNKSISLEDINNIANILYTYKLNIDACRRLEVIGLKKKAALLLWKYYRYWSYEQK